MKWCLTCTELPKCTHATGEMVVEGLGCAKWSPVDVAVQEAREELAILLGPHAILSKPNPKYKSITEKELIMPDDNRSKLRVIALKSGLLEKMDLARSLRWSAEEFYDKLEGEYEDCREWSQDDMDLIIKNIGKGGKPAAKKRTPVKSSEDSSKTSNKDSNETSKAAEAPKEEAAPAPKKRRKRRTKAEIEADAAAKAAALGFTVEAKDLGTSDLSAETNVKKKRQPARRKKREPARSEPKDAIFQIDGKAIVEELGIGNLPDQMTSQGALLAGLTLEMEDLRKQINSIEKMLVWFYNTESEDDEEIKNLSEVFGDDD